MVSKNNYIPDRGDVVWVNFNPTRGHEQRGRRPALVISPKIYNKKAGLAVVCPITTQAKGYPFEVLIRVKSRESVVLVDQLRSVDWRERHIVKITKVPASVVNIIQTLLHTLIN